MKNTLNLFILILLSSCSVDNSQENSFVINTQDDMYHAPVFTDLPNTNYEDNTVVCLQVGEKLVPGQIERINESTSRLWFIAEQKAGTSTTYSLSDSQQCSNESYSWKQADNISTQLVLNDQPVISYEYPVYDRDNYSATKKPFHQVYDPLGNGLITKGLGGLYPHHRGIYFGYNHVYVGESDKQIDIWHARDGERSEHSGFVKEFSGPVMGGHIVSIEWKDHDGVPFIEETREIRVFKQPNGESLIDFKSTLRALDKPVTLGGDRQHAGVQFRAAQEVVENAESTRFIRPSDWSHVDPTTEIEEEDMMNLPWNAMHFQIEDRPYTVAYISHPDNPDNAEMSERRYGRFGEFIKHELTKDDPFQLSYRFWIKSGQVPDSDVLDLKNKAYANMASVQK
ncbi:MAG: DUF6807 family protein [Balneolales bacterium]